MLLWSLLATFSTAAWATNPAHYNIIIILRVSNVDDMVNIYTMLTRFSIDYIKNTQRLRKIDPMTITSSDSIFPYLIHRFPPTVIKFTLPFLRYPIHECIFFMGVKLHESPSLKLLNPQN